MARVRAAPVVWEGDASACGRFMIQSEHVRHEGAWYELWISDEACRAVARRLDLALGCYGDKRKIRRLAQRIADAVEADRQASTTRQP